MSISGKQEALENVVGRLGHGQPDSLVYAVKPVSFRALPDAQFAYWVSEKTLRLFSDLPPFENDGRTRAEGSKQAITFAL